MPSLDGNRVGEMLKDLPGWKVEGKHLLRDFRFKDFKQAMEFVNTVADLAEEEGHHPDILVHQWNRVRIDLWTHAADGLTENDFILAAKIDAPPGNA